jgi:hypothetical protein
MSTDAYFVRLDRQRFRATEHTGGAWTQGEQHIAPMAGLLLHETERLAGADGKVLGRLTLDILGVVGVDEFEVECEAVRPGRTISLLEARAVWAGRTVAVARTWRLSPADTAEVAGGAPAAIAGPETLPTWDMTSVWPGGYIASLDVRREPVAQPGRATAWVRSPVDLLADEPVSDLARWVGLLDTANGLSVRESPKEWLFPNLDLTLHLHRTPVGRWVGFDTTVVFGDGGLGLTETVLHDVAGPVGRLAQVLTVRRGS